MKKVVILLLVVFLGYYLFKDPNGLAGASKGGAGALWGAMTQTFTVLIRFFNALFA